MERNCKPLSLKPKGLTFERTPYVDSGSDEEKTLAAVFYFK